MKDNIKTRHSSHRTLSVIIGSIVITGFITTVFAAAVAIVAVHTIDSDYDF